ncbi:hypothetical protein C0081_16850 [Cohaesibacter celericrescens]|uniref:Uncharacterized protein n=1 Tax=Cohaesibacter celericrescens TaxID=2067669 RepID=A0A2N5XMW5_9HYPH|nr:hypothetical protein C0081_16850 [Cohaesibacter celericrescens]
MQIIEGMRSIFAVGDHQNDKNKSLLSATAGLLLFSFGIQGQRKIHVSGINGKAALREFAFLCQNENAYGLERLNQTTSD